MFVDMYTTKYNLKKILKKNNSIGNLKYKSYPNSDDFLMVILKWCTLFEELTWLFSYCVV
jgi:hypothetical protein